MTETKFLYSETIKFARDRFKNNYILIIAFFISLWPIHIVNNSLIKSTQISYPEVVLILNLIFLALNLLIGLFISIPVSWIATAFVYKELSLDEK